jgi:predicted RNA-binding Zn ribbon-like protein
VNRTLAVTPPYRNLHADFERLELRPYTLFMASIDPRPLTGEPLSLELLNTRWRSGGSIRDLLAEEGGLALWLGATGLAERCPATEASLAALRQAREALTAAVGTPSAPTPQARAALNAVLAHARLRRELTASGPASRVEVQDPSWLAAWLAVDDYLALLGDTPDRIRRCADEQCVLHFFDTSQNGRRRWCSMATCGNRNKASRHYARTRAQS